MILIASTLDTAIMKTIPRQTATLTVSQSTCREITMAWLVNVSFHHQNKPEVIRRKQIVQTIVSKQNIIKYLTPEQHTPKNSIKLWKCALLNITYYGWNYPGKRSNSVAVDTLLWQYRSPMEGAYDLACIHITKYEKYICNNILYNCEGIRYDCNAFYTDSNWVKYGH